MKHVVHSYSLAQDDGEGWWLGKAVQIGETVHEGEAMWEGEATYVNRRPPESPSVQAVHWF